MATWLGTRGALWGPECLASRRVWSAVSLDVWSVENWVVSEAPRHRVVERWKLLSFRQSQEQQHPGGPRVGWSSQWPHPWPGSQALEPDFRL